jgi:hypothetical protein
MFCVWSGDVVSAAFFLDKMMMNYRFPREEALRLLRLTTRGKGYVQSIAPTVHLMGRLFTRGPQATYNPSTQRYELDGLSVDQLNSVLQKLLPTFEERRACSVFLTVIRDERDADWMAEDASYISSRTNVFVSDTRFGVTTRLVESLSETLVRARALRPKLIVIMGHGTANGVSTGSLDDVRAFLVSVSEVCDAVLFHVCDFGQSAEVLCSGLDIHVGLYTRKIMRRRLEHVGVYCNTTYAVANTACLCDPSTGDPHSFAWCVQRALVTDTLAHSLRLFDAEPSPMDLVFASAMCGLRSDSQGDAFVFYSPTQGRIVKLTTSV